MHVVDVVGNRPISVHRFPRRALTLSPQLCTGSSPRRCTEVDMFRTPGFKVHVVDVVCKFCQALLHGELQRLVERVPIVRQGERTGDAHAHVCRETPGARRRAGL